MQMMKEISQSTQKRLPQYLSYLRSIISQEASPLNISSAAVAEALGLGEIQVRKDLAAVSGAGRPRIGYIVTDLIEDIENFLGYNSISRVIVVGCGKLGGAILDYDGFSSYGLEIVAGFDIDSSKSGESSFGKEIFNMTNLKSICKEQNIRIAILTVPAAYAQAACDDLIEAGITAILNYSPVHLKVPDTVTVKNENIAVSIAELSKRMVYKF